MAAPVGSQAADARPRAHPAQGRASSTRRASPSSARCRRSASPGVANVHVGRLVELDVEDPSQLDEMCHKLLANPLDRGLRGPLLMARSSASSRFPGTCDDVDAQLAVGKVGEAVPLWHARPRPPGRRRASSSPAASPTATTCGSGAIARFSPVMESVVAVRPRRRAGARHLQRLPGALRGRPAAGRAAAQRRALRFICRQVRPRGRCAPTRRSPRRAPPASGCRSRSKHTTGPLLRAARSPDGARSGRLRYATGHNPNGSQDDIAGVCNEAAQRPRPDAAPRARRRRC